MSQILREEKLIYVNVGENSNKFWHGRLYDDGRVVTEWGRYAEVGGQLQIAGTKEFPGKGDAFLTTKLNEKIKKGYTAQRIVENTASASASVVPTTSLEAIALKQIRYKHSQVPDFIKFLCQTNVHKITSNTTLQYNASTGSFSTALGLITQDGIDEARNYLATINGAVAKTVNVNTSNFEDAVNKYLRIVPQDFGRRKIQARDIFPDVITVQKQSDILDSLEASLTQALKPKVDDTKEQPKEESLFDTDLELLEDTAEIARINALFRSTAKDMHYSVRGMKIKRIFVVGITPMSQAYDKMGATMNNQKELWHGTGTANLLSILKTGFKVSPPSTAAIAGKAFGNGIYFAIHSTKSLQYARGVWHSGGQLNNTCYMFLNDIALGNYYVPRSSTSSNPPSGYDSYWAKPGETGYIQNDEIIVFNAAQVRPKYLLELE